MRRGLFLDRDGVINIDHGYVCSIEDFHFVEGVLDTIRKAQIGGYIPIVVTNQSGIGRGYYGADEFEELSAYMIEKMREAGIDIDREHIFYCPHTPDEGCRCRKPGPAMLLEAIERFDIDPALSVMVGDKQSDIEAGRSAGIGRLLLVEKNKKFELEDIDGF